MWILVPNLIEQKVEFFASGVFECLKLGECEIVFIISTLALENVKQLGFELLSKCLHDIRSEWIVYSDVKNIDYFWESGLVEFGVVDDFVDDGM